MTQKQKVAIIYGGKSVEHQISIRSAKNVVQYLDTNRFESVLIGISRSGSWYLTQSVEANIEEGHPLALILGQSNENFIDLKNQKKIADISAVFPVLHGTDGEDGSVQGLLKSVNLPIVGTGVLGSAMAMDKLVTKRLMQHANIPTSKFLAFDISQKESISFNEVTAKIGLPFIVKPASLGSSVGVSKVNNREQLKKAIEETFKYDSSAIFEEFVEGRELECSVMGNSEVSATLPAEIVIGDKYEFYDYQAKYEDPDAVQLHVPAQVDKDIANQIKELSIKAYKALHCEDFARVDLFLKADGTILINEINTIPGFTNSSMFPIMWQNEGIDYQSLLTQLIEMAQKRHAESSESVTTYQM